MRILLSRLAKDERGLSTAEYAVGTVAVAGLGGILIKLLTSDAGAMGFIELGAGHNAPLRVVHEQAGVHGVERIDVAKDAGHLLGQRVGPHRSTQCLAQLRCQGPPAAVVRAFVQVAVQQIHQQARHELGLL